MRLTHFAPLLFTLSLLAPGIIAAQGNAPPETKLEVVELPDPAKVGHDATATKIDDYQKLPEGFWVHGGYDDVLLSNSYANFVFGAVTEDSKTTETLRAGRVLDIYPNPAAEENFWITYPVINVNAGGSVQNTDMDYSSDAKAGSATVTVFAKDKLFKDVTIDTTYEMQKGWPGTLITTTVRNNGKESVTIPSFADFLGWGGMGTFIPGTGWTAAETKNTKAEFIFGRLYDSIIMMAPKDGYMEIEHRPSQSATYSLAIYKRDIVLKPNESSNYQRWLLTNQGDPAVLFSFVNEQRAPETFGYLAGRVQERVKLPDGRIQDSQTVANSEVRISAILRPDLPNTYIGKPYMYTMTDKNGHFQLSVPAGEYTCTSANYARVYEPSNIAIRVLPKAAAGVDQAVSSPSGLIYQVVDADTSQSMPAKLSFIPLRGTGAPDLGPPGALQSYNMTYTPSGKGYIELPVGNYRVVASCGPEYHTTEERIVVQELQTVTKQFVLKRAFKTDGWISADIGVLTNYSPQSRITPRDRVISSVGEGLDWIVTADPWVATDLQPIVEGLNFADRIRASAGIHVVSTEKHKIGDYLLFPVDLCAGGAATDFSSLKDLPNPAEAITKLRALCPSSVLVANRPIFPNVGLFGLQGYDIAKGKMPPGKLLADVDAWQLWEGKNQGLVAQNYQAYTEMLSRGAKMTAVANSFSGGTYNEEPGYPRIYIPSSESDPRKFKIEELAKNIKEGRVLITNGPFISLTVDGQPMGSQVTDTDGQIDVELKVFTPNWASVASITVNLNGAFVRKFILPSGAVDARAGQVYPTKGSENESRFKLTVSKDAALTVVVEGDDGLNQDPVNPFFLPAAISQIPQGQRTLAFSAPIFIDADGDGQVNLTPEPETPDDKKFIPPF
ncbi:hypothetical protein BH09SUM1_BH09SUM1_20980 [soil metagenome]